jgi:nickel-dependent lactate racemase
VEIRVPYGRSALAAEIPDAFAVDIIELPDVTSAINPIAEVWRAIADPVGQLHWPDNDSVESVAIAVNDKTRPVPHHHLLPPLIDWLAERGVPDDAITLYIAVGSHPPMRQDEFPAVIPPDVLRRVRVVSHDAERDADLVHLGSTARGTAVWANREYVEADVKIVVGTIEPHQFAGFSGGVKSAAIGLAGLATINANHTLMTDPDSLIGTYATNPARRDVEEIGEFFGVQIAVNAILDHRREIVQVLAGDPVAVMEAGAPVAQSICQVAVPQNYGLVITSPGGHPKDINVYQAQKAVSSAARIVRPGGTMILTAACPDGSGSEHYEEWVAGKRTRAEVMDAFQAEGFRIGPHKAFQLARDTEQARLIVCSDMSIALTDRLLLDAADDLQSAVDRALAGLRPGERIAVLPHAATTIPHLDSGPPSVG